MNVWNHAAERSGRRATAGGGSGDWSFASRVRWRETFFRLSPKNQAGVVTTVGFATLCGKGTFGSVLLVGEALEEGKYVVVARKHFAYVRLMTYS